MNMKDAAMSTKKSQSGGLHPRSLRSQQSVVSGIAMSAMRRVIHGGILLVALIALTTSVLGQDLTKVEQGRVYVSNCYRQCSFQGFTSGQTLLATVNYLPSYTAIEALYTCIAAQEHIRNMENCRMQCLDLEEVYKTRKSHARGRFYRFMQDQRATAKAAGLWVDYKNSPSYVAPSDVNRFARACVRYLTGASTSQQKMNEVLSDYDPYTPFTVPEVDPLDLDHLLMEEAADEDEDE